MTWRGPSSQKERIFACLFYLIPLLEALDFGAFFFQIFPPLKILLFPLFLLAPIYFYLLPILNIRIVALALFFGLYLKVVRNESLRHFLRFNAMQALILAVTVFLTSAVLELMGISLALNPLGFSSSLFLILAFISILFVGVYAASFYAIFRSATGLYAEMPIVSDAAYAQTR